MNKSTSFRSLARRLTALVALGCVVTGLVACGEATAAPRTLTLQTLNASGVTGSVSLTDLGSRTRVAITVDPNGNADMPAHIHPGTCDALVPQPMFPLESVKAGTSVTEVPAPMGDLFGTGLAVNIHHSNDDLKTYTACIEIR